MVFVPPAGQSLCARLSVILTIRPFVDIIVGVAAAVFVACVCFTTVVMCVRDGSSWLSHPVTVH